jgi:adenylosuccinate lyase
VGSPAFFALSPLDGRYRQISEPLTQFFSQLAFLKARVQVEVKYFLFLSQHKIAPQLTPKQISQLEAFAQNLSESDLDEIVEIESEVRHDVKAIELFLQRYWQRHQLPGESFLHFGLTSEDVNNLAYGLSLKKGMAEVVIPTLEEILAQLKQSAQAHRRLPMLAHTHGQPAVPTTLGKEFVVFADRLYQGIKQLKTLTLAGKLTGAVGNFNALQTAFPDRDWLKLSQDFVSSLGLEPNTCTTQILPTDSYVRLFQQLALINSILLDFNQDLWFYCGLGYFNLLQPKEQVGSSTMPQKVNPIDFENSEGNLGLANSLLNYFAQKLPISRMQRDLSDSTVKRNFGAALGYCLIGYRSCARGLAKLQPDTDRLATDLDAHWEVVAEGLQTQLRLLGDAEAYEKLRIFAQGKKLNQDSISSFIEELAVDEEIKTNLKKITPQTYLGLAEKIVSNTLERMSHDQ